MDGCSNVTCQIFYIPSLIFLTMSHSSVPHDDFHAAVFNFRDNAPLSCHFHDFKTDL